ncbi:MAG: hypothetical protein RSB67_03580 [Clostridia bacterium]
MNEQNFYPYYTNYNRYPYLNVYTSDHFYENKLDEEKELNITDANLKCEISPKQLDLINKKTNEFNIESTIESKDDIQNQNKDTFRLGPITYQDRNLSLFGFSIGIDDLIIIALMILLLMDGSCNYITLIVLGLLLFNISIPNLKFSI